jgi:hypothetical protein
VSCKEHVSTTFLKIISCLISYICSVAKLQLLIRGKGVWLWDSHHLYGVHFMFGANSLTRSENIRGGHAHGQVISLSFVDKTREVR